MASKTLSEAYERVCDAVDDVRTVLDLEPLDLNESIFTLRKLATRLEAFDKLRSKSDISAYCDEIDKHGVELWNKSTLLRHQAAKGDQTTAKLVAERMCPSGLPNRRTAIVVTTCAL
jgi:hypothetical protein